MSVFTLSFEDSRATQIAVVGGKNASLANMTQELASAGIAVPPGFAVTADGDRFLAIKRRIATIEAEASRAQAPAKRRA